MKNTLLCAVLIALFALPATAKEVAGVNFTDTATVGGQSLTLNGVGLRRKAIFKVYVLGLYLQTPSKDAAKVIAADELKQVRMVMKRDLKKDQISEAIVNGFKANAKDTLPALQARLDKLAAALPDLKEGQELTITYAPGKGTQINTSTGQSLSLEGKDFADALFSVWLGAEPVDGGLKDAMLGKD